MTHNYTQGNYPPRYAVPTARNPLATAGFVVALIGAVLALIPLVGVVAWGISPVGLVLSIVGLVLASRRGVGKGLAIAGVVLGVVGLIVCMIYAASFAAAVSGSAPSTGTRAPVAGAPSTPGTQSAQYGSPLTAGDLTVTVAKPRKRSQEFTGAQWCSTVTYQNTGSSAAPFNPYDWKFRTAAGVEASSSIPFSSSNALRSGELTPGGTVSGEVCGDDSVRDVSAVVYSPGLGFMHELVWQ